jgi:hypothetical protein
LALPLSVRADDSKVALKEKVDRLVRQLGDADSEKQAAATAALLQLGPDILPLLPQSDRNLAEPAKKHLQSIRSAFRAANVRRDLAPRTITLNHRAIGLADALKTVAQQTGMQVVDRRQEIKDVRLALNWKNVTFWQAVDDLALKADLRVSLYDREGKVALVDGPHVSLPVSYDGIFRVGVRRLTSVRDLESNSHFWLIQLEIAWEPRFQPLFLETQPEGLAVQDGNGMELKDLSGGSGRAPVTRPIASEATIRVAAPRRATEKIALLKGSLAVVGPSKMLTFTFDNLAKIDKGKAQQARKESTEGVTATLRELNPNGDRWTISFLLEYPPGGPEFESFESWLVNNQILLEKKDGSGTFPVNGGSEIDEQGGKRATLTYRFIEENNLVLGKPSDWRLVYRTPGTIVKIPVEFEFKDLPVVP